jgi:hypothetical protein
MKRTFFYYIILVMLAITACNGDGGIRPEESLPYDSLREGDLVFRRGRNMTSNIIVAKDSYSYSHIGMLHRSDSGWCVIHAVNDEPDFKGDFDRVKIDRVETFFAYERSSAGAIAHSFIDDSTAVAMSRKALQYVKDSVRFDAEFRLDDQTELYCTELIHILYKSAGNDITEGRRTAAGIFGFPDKIIFPSDILSNKKLQIYFVY